MDNTEKDINKTSAIPSWSGFIYQGKVALYHALSLINQKDQNAVTLQVESLDDFVICDIENKALSLHQVKATNQKKYSNYNKALKQASEVNHNSKCTSQTLRYFHVAQELDSYADFSNGQGGNKVTFYTYSNDEQYVLVDKIDSLINEQIKQCLQSQNSNNCDTSIVLKREKLEALVSAKVNIAHRKNQQGDSKLSAAESTPITFTEICEVLNGDLIDATDENSVLFRFKQHLLARVSEALLFYEEQENSAENTWFQELAKCHNAIANMNTLTLSRLYYSKSPHASQLRLEGFSDTTVDRYADIIAELTELRLLDKELPHYYKNENMGRYLPSVIELDGRGERKHLADIQQNLEGLKTNQHVRHVLYEYENLIIKGMDQKPFRLNSKLTSPETAQGGEDRKITKMKNIRFVSLKEAKDELAN